MVPQLPQQQAEQEANSLIAQDKIKDEALQAAQGDLLESFAGYTFLRFFPGMNIYYNYRLMNSIANYQKLKYGRSKASIFVGFALTSIICFLIITFGLPILVNGLNLPGYSYVILFLLTIVVVFIGFETWVKSKK